MAHSPKESTKSTKLEFESFYRGYPVLKDTLCGYSVFKGFFLQFLARKNAFIFVNGVAGCLIIGCFTYFSGSISSIEKLYGIPSQRSGILSVGNDISQVMVSLFFAYYLGQRHRPRWMAVGLLCMALYCFIAALPHFLYGSGTEMLLLTKEYGELNNSTAEVLVHQINKTLCQSDSVAADFPTQDCKNPDNYMPQVILFVAQIIAGVGNGIYSSLNAAYLDDNVQKSKAPWVISLTQFLKLFGPALGFALASLCLKVFIDPSATPLITPEDPRWIGAWWIGMIVLGVLCTFTAFLVSLFPKRMPRYVAKMEYHQKLNERPEIRNEVEAMIEEQKVPTTDEVDYDIEHPNPPLTSLGGLWETTLRIFRNKIFMLNMAGLILYFYGCFPYWIFLSKYIEVQYKMSASEANMYTGVVGLVFSALGVLASGVVLSKYKPSAQKIALWGVFTTLCTCLIFLSYNWMGCDASDRTTTISSLKITNSTESCNSGCHCDFVKYTPVCGEDGHSYNSPCHAGCRTAQMSDSGSVEQYLNCSCVLNSSNQKGGFALPGACKVDCWNWSAFYLFLAFNCLNNFLSATGIAGSVLIGVRSVLREDKTFALGMKFALTSMLAFIPSPIMFGAIMDRTCVFWGKSVCGEKSNCWIYDGEMFRFHMNTIASGLMFCSSIFSVGVWRSVKNLSIFEEDQQVKGDLGNKSQNGTKN